VASLRGVGSTIIIMRLEYQVRLTFFRPISNDCNIFLDLKGVGEMSFSFDLGKPFQPYEQLMGVMPEASKELLPMAYQVR
jgi:Xrn1 helical domain